MSKSLTETKERQEKSQSLEIFTVIDVCKGNAESPKDDYIVFHILRFRRQRNM